MKIVVFDLDGVIFKSPSRETIIDPDYWVRHWSNPGLAEPNPEMVLLARALQWASFDILFLTARPDMFRVETIQAMSNCGIDISQLNHVHDVLDHDWIGTHSGLHLKMCDVDLSMDGWTGSGDWKLDVIENVKIGHEVMFMIEDHKPNAEEIRKAIPVLLYEQRRHPAGD